MCMSELLDCFFVAKLMIARGTPFEIGLIIRLESWLRMEEITQEQEGQAKVF